MDATYSNTDSTDENEEESQVISICISTYLQILHVQLILSTCMYTSWDYIFTLYSIQE